MPLGKLSPAASAEARVSVPTLPVQHFLLTLDKEQSASGSASSAEHSNSDTMKLAARKLKLNLYYHSMISSTGRRRERSHLPPQNSTL